MPSTTATPPASSAARLLDVWEQGSACSSPRRALLLLAAAHPELDDDALGALPVGRRDALLLRLRARLFGPTLDATAACPACAERLEFTLSIDDLVPPDSPAATAPPAPAAPLVLELDEHTLELRPPSAADLAALDACAPASAEAELLRRCILSVRPRAASASSDSSASSASLPPDSLGPWSLDIVHSAPALAAVSARLAEADPLADLRLGLSCPACSHAWSDPLDIAAYLWRELDAWARRVLHEVHVLAHAYGWTEATILALSPARRRHYLDLVAA